MIEKRAQALLAHFNEKRFIGEARRTAGFARHAVGPTTPLGGGVVGTTAGLAVKHHTRKKYGLHGHIDNYKMERRAITHHPTMTRKQRRRAKEHLYHSTLASMAQHIQAQRGGSMNKAYRTAHRALHGTVFGTSVV